MNNDIVLGIIASVPTTATAVSTIYLNSRRKKDRDEAKKDAERNASKSSIQNMITQDIIRVELLGKLPENKDSIEHEYEHYRKCDGNGTVTRQVNEYNSWYNSKELCLKCQKVLENKGEQISCSAGIKNDK